jgi:hypothetical protein
MDAGETNSNRVDFVDLNYFSTFFLRGLIEGTLTTEVFLFRNRIEKD